MVFTSPVVAQLFSSWDFFTCRLCPGLFQRRAAVLCSALLFSEHESETAVLQRRKTERACSLLALLLQYSIGYLCLGYAWRSRCPRKSVCESCLETEGHSETRAVVEEQLGKKAGSLNVRRVVEENLF